MIDELVLFDLNRFECPEVKTLSGVCIAGDRGFAPPWSCPRSAFFSRCLALILSDNFVRSEMSDAVLSIESAVCTVSSAVPRVSIDRDGRKRRV